MRRSLVAALILAALVASNLDALVGSPKTDAVDVLVVPRYSPESWPAHFEGVEVRREDNTPRDNPTTDAGVHLGRYLFYDVRLSRNGKVSCGSCHQQKRAFAESKRLSTGIFGRKGSRNTMALANLRWERRGFFWDARATTLEQQVLGPLQNGFEMGSKLEDVVAKVAREARYRALFEAAFGDPKVTTDRVAKALAQFLRSLVSSRSKFDVGVAKAESIVEDFANFTALENEGKKLFLDRGRGSCVACHMLGGGGRRGGAIANTALFIGRDFSNNGLETDDGDYTDGGRYYVTADQPDYGLFKTPSLRNVEATGPYMHDGRLATLEAVIEHYDRGIKPHRNLDRRLRGRRFGEEGSALRMNFTSRERRALVAFLKTLTDREFLTDPRFSSPYRK